MKKLSITTIVIVIIVVILILSSGKFFLGMFAGFILAYILYKFFGEQKIKDFLTNLFNKGKTKLEEAKDNLQNERQEAYIDSVALAETGGMYQVIIVSGGKCWMLKPTHSSTIPPELYKGAKITIVTTRNIGRSGIEVKTRIIAQSTSFEVA